MGAQAKSQDPPTAEDAAKGGPRRAVLRRERPRYLKRKIVGRKKEEEIERKEERRESQEHNKEDKFTCIHIHIGGTLYVVRRSRSTILILSGQDIEIASLIVQTYITSQDRRNCLRERRRVPGVPGRLRTYAPKATSGSCSQEQGRDMRHEVHLAFSTLAPLERAPLLTCCCSFFSFVLW